MRASHQLLTMDLRKRYALIRAPTRILWGSRDHLLPPSFGRRLEAAIPGATMVEIPDAGHSPMWENPDAFNRELVAFLDEPVPAPLRAGPRDTATRPDARLDGRCAAHRTDRWPRREPLRARRRFLGPCPGRPAR